jgi:subfamily B ATP-binding cassette protein MsbA
MAASAPPKKPPVNMARAWSEARTLMWKHRRSLVFGLLLMLVSRLAGLVLPFSSKFLIDDVLGKQQLDKLVPLALAVGAATVVQAITSFALSQIVSIAAQRAISDMRIEIQRHVLRLPVSFFDATKSGVLISRVMSDAEGVRNLIGTGLVQLAGGLLTAAIALGVLFYLNWHLTASTIIVLLAFGAMMAVAFKRLRPLFRKRSEINAEVTGRLGEALGGIRTVKVYTAEEREERIFADGIERLFRNVASTITGTSAVGAATTVIVGVIGVLMIIVGGRSIAGGSMTLGDFVMYIFFIGLVAAPLVQIASIGTQVSEAFAGLDRIREIRLTATEDQEDAHREAIPEIVGDVAFERVSFAYVPGVPVLRDVSFATPAGTTTALVGSSGAGKSTLIGLVTAFNRPTSGRVLVDGRDVATLRLRDYRANLGVVMQDNFLFDGTIKENIAFAKPDATDDEVRAVSRIAHCDEFIEKFEAKYDTIVGERGVKLSDSRRPAYPHSRRGDVQPGQRERGAHP